MDKLTGEWKNLYNGIIKEYTLLPNQHNPAADNITPIHLLIIRATETKNNPNFIELLNRTFQSKDLDVNVQDGKGRTPLYLAIELENYDIANVLIDGGVDITIPTNDGISPLILAAIQSSEDEAPEKNLLLNKLIEKARPIKNERFNEHWDKLTDGVKKKITNAGFQTREERATAEAKADCKAFLAKHGILNKKQFLKWSKVHHPNKGGNTWLFKLVRSCIEKLTEEEEAKEKGETVEEAREREAMERETEEKEELVKKEREAMEEVAREREEAARARREKREAEIAKAERARIEKREAEIAAAARKANEVRIAREAEIAEAARKANEVRIAREAREREAAREAREREEAERARREAAAAAREAREAREATTRKATTHTEKLQEIQRETAKEVGKLVAEMERLRIEIQKFRKEEPNKIPGTIDLLSTQNTIRPIRAAQRIELTNLTNLLDSITQDTNELSQMKVNAEANWNQEFKSRIERNIQSNKINDCKIAFDDLVRRYNVMQERQRLDWDAKQQYGISPMQRKKYQGKILYYRARMIEITIVILKLIQLCKFSVKLNTEWNTILKKDRKAFSIEQDNLQDVGEEEDASFETKQRLQSEIRKLTLRFESDSSRISTLPALKAFEDENSNQLQIIVEIFNTLRDFGQEDLPEGIEESITRLIEEQSKISGFFLSDIGLPIDKEVQKKQILKEARRFLNTIPAEPLEEYVAVSRDVMIKSILSELKNPTRNDEAIAQLIGRVFTTNKDGINTVIDRKGNTLLILTILHRLPEATLKLLALGAPINIQNEDGLTALMLAIATTNPLNIREKGAFRVITTLLENASLDVNLDSKDNNDAYDYASRLHSRIRSDRDKQVFKEKVLDKLWAKRATRARIAARRAAKGALGAVKGFFTIPDFNILGDM